MDKVTVAELLGSEHEDLDCANHSDPSECAELTKMAFIGPDGSPLTVGYTVIATLLHATIFCWGVLGNAVLIDVVRRTPRFHRSTYSYLVSQVLFCVAVYSVVPY